jgi:hypothetical protein
MLSGKDVSSYQSPTWDLRGDSFQIIKCTEATSYENPYYHEQLAYARSHGQVIGHYHFGHSGGVAEAQFFLSRVDLRPGEFLAFDWEFAGETQAERDAFMKYCKAKHPNVKVVLYCNLDFWVHNDTESYAGDGLWIADIVPAGHPRVTHPWVFHQYSEAGGIDHDVANFATVAELKAWAGTSAPAPTPAPVATLTETGLSVGIRVAFTVKASAAMTVEEIGVAVRDSKGVQHNFPPEAYNTKFAAGQSLNLATPEVTLPAGSYTLTPCYKAGGAWHSLPTHTVTV